MEITCELISMNICSANGQSVVKQMVDFRIAITIYTVFQQEEKVVFYSEWKPLRPIYKP